MIERINDFVARVMAAASARVDAALPASVLWTVLFLVVISLVLPLAQLTLAQVNGPLGKVGGRERQSQAEISRRSEFAGCGRMIGCRTCS